jgi:hypothetical protein
MDDVSARRLLAFALVVLLSAAPFFIGSARAWPTYGWHPDAGDSVLWGDATPTNATPTNPWASESALDLRDASMHLYSEYGGSVGDDLGEIVTDYQYHATATRLKQDASPEACAKMQAFMADAAPNGAVICSGSWVILVEARDQ